MTIDLNLPPALEQHLRAAAEARHVPIEDYILSLLKVDSPQIPQAPDAAKSRAEFRAAMMKLRKSGEPTSEPYETYSRETIYQDHD